MKTYQVYNENPTEEDISRAWKTAIVGTVGDGKQVLLREIPSTIPALEDQLREADRRAGEAERLLAYEVDSTLRRESWLKSAKESRGYHHHASFDTVWSDTCAKADALASTQEQLKKAVELLQLINATPAWYCQSGMAGPETVSKFLAAYVAEQKSPR